MDSEMKSAVSLSLLGVICDRDKRDKAFSLFESEKSYFNLGMLGKGTANSKMLGYLGLGETQKAVFFSILPSRAAGALMHKLNEVLELKKPGHGIAFSAKMREGCYHKPVLLSGKESGEKEVESAAEHELIMVVLNHGYTEEVMRGARVAGAGGGTVLHARGCGVSGAEKFFGITIEPEKDMIIIVAPSGKTREIMYAIADANGPGTDAAAVSFAIPLTGVTGVADSGL